jgi:hypothetical protein
MGNNLLQTIVLAPVLLGMYVATTRRLQSGLWRLLALLLTFDIAYILLLYVLRHRWL